MSEKSSVTQSDLVLLEKAASLKTVTNFEECLIMDRLMGVKKFGLKCAMSDEQRAVLMELADRYDKAYLMKAEGIANVR
jgi:hypothetical protein